MAGLAPIEVAFWLTGAALLVAGLVLAQRALDLSRRPRCPGCWYDMGGHAAALFPITCPECGRSIARSRALRRVRRRPVRTLLALAVLALAACLLAGAPRAVREGWPAAVPTSLLIATSPIIYDGFGGVRASQPRLLPPLQALLEGRFDRDEFWHWQRYAYLELWTRWAFAAMHHLSETPVMVAHRRGWLTPEQLRRARLQAHMYFEGRRVWPEGATVYARPFVARHWLPQDPFVVVVHVTPRGDAPQSTEWLYSYNGGAEPGPMWSDNLAPFGAATARGRTLRVDASLSGAETEEPLGTTSASFRVRTVPSVDDLLQRHVLSDVRPFLVHEFTFEMHRPPGSPHWGGPSAKIYSGWHRHTYWGSELYLCVNPGARTDTLPHTVTLGLELELRVRCLPVWTGHAWTELKPGAAHGRGFYLGQWFNRLELDLPTPLSPPEAGSPDWTLVVRAHPLTALRNGDATHYAWWDGDIELALPVIGTPR